MLLPFVIPQYFSNAGAVAAGYQLFFYVNGTFGSTNAKQATYDGVGGSQNPNPVILDSSGRPDNSGTPIDIYLTPGLSYTVVLAADTDTDPPTSPIKQVDNVVGDEDLTVWRASYSASRTDSDTFTISGQDVSGLFTVGMPVKLTGGADRFATVSAVSYSTDTTVDVTNIVDSTGATSTLHASMDTAYYASNLKRDLADSTTSKGASLVNSESDYHLQTYLDEHVINVKTEQGSITTANIQASIDALPAGGGTVLIDNLGATATIADEIDITTNNVKIIVAMGTTLDMSSISGTGTSSVRPAGTDVISIFKVTGDNCTIQVDGVLYSNNDTVDGKNTVGVLGHACERLHVTGEGKIEGQYCGVWPVKNSLDFKCTIKHLTGCLFNIGLGSYPSVATDPEVTGVDIRVGLSESATSDGIKAISYTYNTSVVGGIHRNHTRDGIDLYVGGEEVSIVGTQCFDNGFHGIDCKYGVDTEGAGGNDGGYNRKVTIQGNVCSGNSGFGMAITDENDDGIVDFSIANNVSTGNTDAGYKITGSGYSVMGNLAADNGTYGYEIASLIDSAIIGNVARNNGTGLTEQKGFFFLKSTLGGKCSGLSIIGNIAIGDATNQLTGFDIRDANVENSTVIGNRAEGHGTQDWQTDTTFTNEDVHFDWNIGLVTYRHGSFTGTTDGNGTLAVNHGLHTTPNYVNAHVTGDNDYLIHVHNVGATQFSVTIKDSAGADVASTSVTFYWEARTHGATA